MLQAPDQAIFYFRARYAKTGKPSRITDPSAIQMWYRNTRLRGAVNYFSTGYAWVGKVSSTGSKMYLDAKYYGPFYTAGVGGTTSLSFNIRLFGVCFSADLSPSCGRSLPTPPTNDAELNAEFKELALVANPEAKDKKTNVYTTRMTVAGYELSVTYRRFQPQTRAVFYFSALRLANYKTASINSPLTLHMWNGNKQLTRVALNSHWHGSYWVGNIDQTGTAVLNARYTGSLGASARLNFNIRLSAVNFSASPAVPKDVQNDVSEQPDSHDEV